MMVPFIMFWVLIFIGREDLGFKGIFISIIIWLVMLIGCVYFTTTPYLFVALQAVFDAILLLVIFRRDIKLR